MSIEMISEILFEISNHVKQFDSDFTQWYAGITFDPKKRAEQHIINLKGEYFKDWNIGTKDNAKKIEYILHSNGFKKEKVELAAITAIERLREDSTYIYVYKKEE